MQLPKIKKMKKKIKILLVVPFFYFSCSLPKSSKPVKEIHQARYLDAINFCKAQKLDSLLYIYKILHENVPCEVKIVNQFMNNDRSDYNCDSLLRENNGGLPIRQKYKVSPNDSLSFLKLEKMYSTIYDNVKSNRKESFIEIYKYYFVFYVKKINRIKHGDNYRVLLYFNPITPRNIKSEIIRIFKAELITDNYYKAAAFSLRE